MKCPTCDQDMPVDEMTFGGRLKSARVVKGLTVKELGAAVGYKTGKMITRWEEGSAPMPDSVKALTELSEALNTDVFWLMMGVSNTRVEIETQQSIEVPNDVTHEGPAPVSDDELEGIVRKR